MLNAEIIGGKKGDRYRDDIWTMKYLSGFKWEMLGEQVGEYCLCAGAVDEAYLSAYERQAHTARLRNEVSQSRAEQSEYLKNVELARVLDKRKARKEATGAPATTPTTGGTEDRAKGERSYRQREPAKAKGEGMDGLMSSVFG
jgi:ESF2/ABP1 family protein